MKNGVKKMDRFLELEMLVCQTCENIYRASVER